MGESLIERYLNNGKKGYSSIKSFVEEIFALYTDNDIKVKTKISYMHMPGLANGYIKVIRREGGESFYIIINLFPFRERNKTSSVMKLFYLYVTVLHEIEHIRIILNKADDMWDKSRMLAMLEYLAKEKRPYIYERISVVIANKMIKYSKYKDITSQLEIECNYLSMKKGIEDFRDFLSDAEFNKVDMMYRALQFLRDNFEIGYITHYYTYNKFMQYVVKFGKRIQEENRILEKYPQLRMIYHNKGELKAIEELFENMNDSNKEISNYLIFYMFLYLETDFSVLFEKVKKLKKHIEDLANEYTRKYLLYIENKAYGEVFVDKEILEDNERLMLKNIIRLNMLMDKYGMIHMIGVITSL